jgi:hypothetical protein
MSKILPVFVNPGNPVGLDKQIIELQQVIAQATFINDQNTEELYFDQGLLLPLALKSESNSSPIVYWTDKEYFPAKPTDQFRITSFFYQEDSANFVSQNEVRYTVNLVVWFNQDKYARNKGYQIKQFLNTELLTLLREHLSMEDTITLQSFTENENIFSNYTLSEEQKTRMKYPHQALRIRFQLSAEFDCGDEAKFNVDQAPLPPLPIPCDPPQTWDELVALIGRGYNFPIPDGQTTVYRTGDAADIEATIFAPIRATNTLKAHNGLSSWDTLINNNIFGNLNRFTDQNGLQVYGDFYKIDHASGMGWHIVGAGSANFDDAIDAGLAFNSAGFSDFFLASRRQLESINKATGNFGFPDILNNALGSSTTVDNNTSQRYTTNTNNRVLNTPKTDVFLNSFCRKHF